MYRLIAVAILTCLAIPLRATVLVPAEFREIVAGSQVIVHGRVAAVTPEWSADRRRIDSVVTVEVAAYLKGGPGRTVTFRAPGGQIGRFKSITVGAPEFRSGEEAVFFLTAQGPGVARVFGLSQGVYRVRLDPGTGRRLVIPAALTARSDEPEVIRRGTVERKPVALDAFASQVRNALAQGGAR